MSSFINFNNARRIRGMGNPQLQSQRRMDSFNCCPGFLKICRGVYFVRMLWASQGHGHESHIIFASHFRTLGCSVRMRMRGSRQAHSPFSVLHSLFRSPISAPCSTDLRALNIEPQTEMPSLTARGE